MSEKLYALLLRLYPSHFQNSYGDEALLLFSDRLRHEQGFFAGLRLWLDLARDLAVSVPREHRRVPPTANARVADVVPSFHFLTGESPHPAALVLGALLSLAIAMALTIPNAPGPLSTWDTWLASAQSPAVLAEPMDLDATERHRVIAAVADNLTQHYVDPPVAKQAADALLTHEKRGDYDAVTDNSAFAKLLTKQLRDVSDDPNMVVVFSKDPLPDRPPGPNPERLARYRKAMKEENCTFEKAAVLPHNIGYLKLNSFPDPSVCRATAVDAMALLNNVDAVIFDLRDNGGGYPEMVSLIASYLFDHPEYMYCPKEGTTGRSWTQSPVAGTKLADKPVYILTSAATFSGAEQFTYDLKMLKRATIVGENTGGGAHAGAFHRIDAHFGMGLLETRAINPFAKNDWEGVGIQPDVKVDAAAALVAAQRLAESKLRKTR